MAEQQTQLSRVIKLRNWYGKYERQISSISLIGGFVFDAVTLKRVDLFWENFWVVAHLIIVGVCIVLVHAIEKNEGDERNPSSWHFWLVNTLQFFFGGILSTYLVFYFRSGDILVSWPFLLVLALAFWANEALKRSFVRLSFQIGLFFLSIYSFAIFLVPILLHQLGNWIFILSGVVSLIFIALFLWLIRYVSKKEFEGGKTLLFSTIAGVFILINTLYFTNLLPPIPLSLKDAGVYYSMSRGADGNFVGVTEEKPWTDYFKFYPKFNYLPGQPVVIFTAIFSPSDLNLKIIHEWQRLDKNWKWVTVSQVHLTVVGGRDGGFRTFSQKTVGLSDGKWRVNIKTTTGQFIGTVRFTLVEASDLPKVEQVIKD
jgi:hypothetical protein